MINAAKLLLNSELTTALAQLYCGEKHIYNYTFEPITKKQIDQLISLNLIDDHLKITNYKVDYAAFEHYRQILHPGTLDHMLLQEIEENKVILDLCSGPGATVRALLGNQPKYIYAFDHDQFSVELVNQLAALMVVNNVHAEIADAYSLPVEDQSVDAVVNRVSLQYLDVNKTLDEVNRVLRNKGCAIFVVHGSGYVIYSALKRDLRTAIIILIRGLLFNITKSQAHPKEIYLTPKTLIYLLKKRGFSDFSILHTEKTLNYGPFPLYFALICYKNKKE